MKRFLLALLLLLPLAANGHVEHPVCVDAQKRMVRFAPVPWEMLAMRNTAVAMATTIGPKPFILYDFEEFDRMDELTRDFIFAHECAHHALNDLVNGPAYPMVISRKSMELSADCFAGTTLRRLGEWSFEEVEIALRKNFWEHDISHGSQDERIAKIKSCWDSADVAQ